MQLLLRVLLLLSITSVLCAQRIDSLNYGPEPQGGISGLALNYFKINFTKSQRALLNQNAIELIYGIDSKGKPTLEKVNGVDDPAIVDSLNRKTAAIPNFQPQVVDGKTVNSMYFLSIQFPTYQRTYLNGFSRKLKKDDFEYLELGGAMDILIGGAFNSFYGSANDYLRSGGGMKIDMIYSGRKKVGLGLTMVVHGNQLKQNYPINSTRTQNSAPSTFLVGLVANKTFTQDERHHSSIQIEANYVIQNITAPIDNRDKEYTQFQGFSPSILFNYSIQLGRDKIGMYQFQPAVMNSWLNFHLGLRPIFLDFSKGNGTMIELGVCYKLRTGFVRNYQLKE